MRFVKWFVIVEAKLCQMPQTEVIAFNWGIPPIFLVFHFQGILVLLNINQIKDWGRSWDGSWFKPKIILKKDMSENFAGKEYGKMWVWHVQTGALITGLISSTCFETGRMCRKDTNAVIQTLIKSSKSRNRPLLYPQFSQKRETPPTLNKEMKHSTFHLLWSFAEVLMGCWALFRPLQLNLDCFFQRVFLDVIWPRCVCVWTNLNTNIIPRFDLYWKVRPRTGWEKRANVNVTGSADR